MSTKELARKIEKLIKAQGAETDFFEDDGCLHVGTTIRSKHFEHYVIVFTCFEDRVTVTYLPPTVIRRESYPEVCEYLMRVNFQLPRGKMLLDYEKAGLRFIYSMDIATVKKDIADAFDDMTHAPLLAMEAIVPACISVMNKKKTPTAAAANFYKDIKAFAKELSREEND